MSVTLNSMNINESMYFAKKKISFLNTERRILISDGKNTRKARVLKPVLHNSFPFVSQSYLNSIGLVISGSTQAVTVVEACVCVCVCAQD